MIIKSYPETHQTGIISIENLPDGLVESRNGNLVLFNNSMQGDFGLQVASDGRVWVCVDGVAFIRFKPLLKEEKLNAKK